MPTEIWLAPVGAGKTEYALEQLVHTIEAQPFARVWVLVSGKRQEDAFRQRLVERAGADKLMYKPLPKFNELQQQLETVIAARRPKPAPKPEPKKPEPKTAKPSRVRASRNTRTRTTRPDKAKQNDKEKE